MSKHLECVADIHLFYFMANVQSSQTCLDFKIKFWRVGQFYYQDLKSYLLNYFGLGEI